MALSPIIITRKTKKKFRVDIDQHSFERLADSLGFFRPEFLESLDRADDDIKHGRIKKLGHLRNVRS